MDLPCLIRITLNPFLITKILKIRSGTGDELAMCDNYHGLVSAFAVERIE